MYRQADEEDGSITVIRDSAGSNTWSQPVSPGFQDKVISQMFEKSQFDHTMHPWPADRVERWPLERLIPYANNPRLHSEADLDKIAAAIRKWGWTMPVLVDEEGGLICRRMRGSGRRQSWGSKSIPVIVARGWSEEEKRAYRLADNQLAARASWDLEQLGNELRELAVCRFRSRSDRLRAGPARNHPGRVGIERSDGSRQRPGSAGAARHPARRCMAVGRRIGWVAATAPARRMSSRCWPDQSLI